MKLRSAFIIGMFLLCAAFGTNSALALPVVIDFGSGLVGSTGTVTLFSDGNLSGVGIGIGQVTIENAPLFNDTYFVYGPGAGYTITIPGVGSFPVPSSGLLSFSTGGLAGANFIQISGYIPSIGMAAANVPLLQGTIAGFNMSLNGLGLVSAFGPDEKHPTLLTALGLNPNKPFEYFGWSLATNALSLQSPTSSVISTDIRNVPEPAMLLLLGSGLLGASIITRLRKK